MDEPSKEVRDLLAQAIIASGFPYQAKIESLIEASHGWSVIASEVSWLHREEEKFLDIVACRGRTHLVIECKKTIALTQQRKSGEFSYPAGMAKRSYAFLRRNTVHESKDAVDRVTTTFLRDADSEDDPNLSRGVAGTSIEFEPPSYESSLCIAIDVDNRQTLEQELGTLVRGTHQYASDYFNFTGASGGTRGDVFVCVLVTTAPLYAVEFDPARVDAGDGSYQLDSGSLEPVPWIRFTKAFMANGTYESDVRTVIIVQGRHLERFLQEFRIRGEKPEGDAE